MMLDGQQESRPLPLEEEPTRAPKESNHAPLPPPPAGLKPDEASKAAALIQRNYRGYRDRRELAGVGVSASSRRWVEVR